MQQRAHPAPPLSRHKDGSFAAIVLMFVAMIAILVFLAEVVGFVPTEFGREEGQLARRLDYKPFSPPRLGCNDVLFIKMKQCASTTFLEVLKHIRSRCKEGKKSGKMQLVWGEQPITKLQKSADAARLRQGHLTIAVMREPLSRQISQFHQCRYWKEHGECKKWAKMGAERFFARKENDRIDNLQARFLGWDPEGTISPEHFVDTMDFIVLRERMHEGFCLLHLLTNMAHVTDMLYVTYKERTDEDRKKSEELMRKEGAGSDSLSEEALRIARSRSKADARAYEAAVRRHEATVAAAPRVGECVARYETLLAKALHACGERASEAEDGGQIRQCLDNICKADLACSRNDIFWGSGLKANSSLLNASNLQASRVARPGA